MRNTIIFCLLLVLSSCGSSDGSPSTGDLVVIVTSSGPEPDGDGYTLTVAGVAPLGVAAQDTVELVDLNAGEHTATLTGVEGNCAGSTEATRVIPAGGVDTVTFNLACGSTHGGLVVQVTTSGVFQDPDGYTIQVGGSSTLPLATNDTIGPVTLLEGVRTVVVTGATLNCSPSPAVPANVIVVAGAVDTLEIHFVCTVPRLLIQREGAASDGIERMNPDGTLRSLVLLESGGAQYRRATYSPDRSRTALDHLISGGDGNHGVSILEADSASPWPLVADSGDTFKPRWRPDGGALLVVRSANGSTWRITTVAFPGGALTPITPDTLQVGSGDWSPDGTRIVFTASLPGFVSQLLWVTQANGTGLTSIPLPGGVEDVYQPRWSPTGNRILFSEGSASAVRFWTIGADGSAPAVLNTPGYRPFGIASWAPSGGSIVVAGEDSTTGGYFLLRLLPGGAVTGTTPAPTGAWLDPDWR